MTDILFLSIAFGGLVALAAVLVLTGRLASVCPESRNAARLATLVVTTGYAAIGAGVIALIGAMLPQLAELEGSGLYLTLGLTSIALGIGFFFAVGQLRDTIRAAAEMRARAPAD